MYSSPSRPPSPPPSHLSSSVTAALHQLVDLQHISVKYCLYGPKSSSVEVEFHSRMLLFTTVTHNPVVNRK